MPNYGFFMILVSTGATDIGRKSVWDLAVATLGTGRITALFHCMGTTEVDKGRLNSWANCLLKTGAPSLSGSSVFIIYLAAEHLFERMLLSFPFLQEKKRHKLIVTSVLPKKLVLSKPLGLIRWC